MEAARKARRILTGLVLATPVCLAILASIPALAFPGVHADVTPPPEVALQSLEVRGAVLTRGIGLVEDYYDTRVRPVEQILEPYHDDIDFVRSVSMALVTEAEKIGMDPRALASVLLVENPWLDPDARSSVGAVGLMQVMPFHAGRWGCDSSDLTDVRTNICHGARIFAAYLEQKGGDVDRALLAYNGCVTGKNTPNCHLYPSRVYTNAGRVAMQRWLDTP